MLGDSVRNIFHWLTAWLIAFAVLLLRATCRTRLHDDPRRNCDPGLNRTSTLYCMPIKSRPLLGVNRARAPWCRVRLTEDFSFPVCGCGAFVPFAVQADGMVRTKVGERH